jgi:hypothetical protein
MAVALIPSIEEKENLHLEWNISTTLKVSAPKAKRKVTRFFIDEVSLFVGPKSPFLVVTKGDQIFWHFPIHLSLGRYGDLGLVGEVDVDAYSGKLLVTDETIEEIKANAERLAGRATTQAVN